MEQAPPPPYADHEIVSMIPNNNNQIYNQNIANELQILKKYLLYAIICISIIFIILIALITHAVSMNGTTTIITQAPHIINCTCPNETVRIVNTAIQNNEKSVNNELTNNKRIMMVPIE